MLDGAILSLGVSTPDGPSSAEPIRTFRVIQDQGGAEAERLRMVAALSPPPYHVPVETKGLSRLVGTLGGVTGRSCRDGRHAVTGKWLRWLISCRRRPHCGD